MRVSKARLRQIIKEETEAVLALSEINPRHKKDGTWARKNKGAVYSLTKGAADAIGDESELEMKRGRITKGNKIASKFGMNSGDDQCGRTDFQTGNPKPKKARCRDYKKKYTDKNEGQKPAILNPADDAYLNALVARQVKSALQAVQDKGGNKGSGCSWQMIMTALNDITTAEKARKPAD